MSLPSRPFSQRFGVRPAPPNRRPDEFPDSAKAKLYNLVDQARQRLIPGAWSLGPPLARALGRMHEGPGSIGQIGDLINSLEWWECYDFCEELLGHSRLREELAAEIDGIFASEGLAYRMTANGIEWRFSQPAEATISEARHLLVENESFAGPCEQWEKALGHLGRRPPDPENCIKDSIGALEGLARILSGSPSETLGQIIKPLAGRLGIHPALASAISNLYGYRSDEQAVAHGATAALQGLVLEAELVVHWSAAVVVYLTRKSAREALTSDH